jgi:hypothetical protein
MANLGPGSIAYRTHSMVNKIKEKFHAFALSPLEMKPQHKAFKSFSSERN